MGAFPVWYAIVPIKVIAAALSECRHNATELGMDGSTVVALVVIFNYDLPVGRYLVANAFAYPQITERITLQASCALAKACR